MILPPGREVGHSEYLTDCPSCGKVDHFYINLSTGKGHCKVCHVGYRGWKTTSRAFGIDMSDDDRLLTLPVEAASRRHKDLSGRIPAWDSPEARSYLKKRRLDSIITWRAGIEWHPPTGQLAIMTTSVSRTLGPDLLVRNIRHGGKWIPANSGLRLKEYGFGHLHIRPSLKGLVLMEGIFDLLTTRMLGHGLALCGSSLSRNWARWISERFESAVLWFDPDQAGIEGVEQAQKTLRGMGVMTAVLEGRDPKLLNHNNPHDAGILDKLIQYTRSGKLSRELVDEVV